MMKILVIGSGAREHAIAKALNRSPQNPAIFCYGNSQNPGIQSLSEQYSIGDLADCNTIVKMAKKWNVNMAIIGPEAPLAFGLSDILWNHNIPAIGPKKTLAQIETSKGFTRTLLKKYHIAGSLEFRMFHNLNGVKNFLEYLGTNGYVIKADGLMGGKGVKVSGEHLHSFDEAYQFCQTLHEQGCPFIIEEKISGQEFSAMCFCDGHTLVPMPIVQDHKRAFIHDAGPNTGGMGSYSDSNHSLPFLNQKNIQDAQHINQAVLNALNSEYSEKYIGILYGSFMATANGIRLIEYNARFGDPEALNVLSILKSDFVTICNALVNGCLSEIKISFDELATVCKYAVPEGYPDNPIQDSCIDIGRIKNPESLYYSSVSVQKGKIYTTSSRSIAVLGKAKTIFDAEKIAEEEINRIQGKLFHRPDIGLKASLHDRL